MDKRNTDVIGRQSGRQKRKAKGTVKIESDKGWLRLRFTHAGKRRAFALGLPDTIINRKFAEQKARQIELKGEQDSLKVVTAWNVANNNC